MENDLYLSNEESYADAPPQPVRCVISPSPDDASFLLCTWVHTPGFTGAMRLANQAVNRPMYTLSGCSFTPAMGSTLIFCADTIILLRKGCQYTMRDPGRSALLQVASGAE